MFLLLLSPYSSAFFHSTVPSTNSYLGLCPWLCLLSLSFRSGWGNVPPLTKCASVVEQGPWLLPIEIHRHHCIKTILPWAFPITLVCGWDAKADPFLGDREPLYQSTLSQGLSMGWLNLPQTAWQARLQCFHLTFLLSLLGARPALRSDSSSWPSQPHLLSHRHFLNKAQQLVLIHITVCRF